MLQVFPITKEAIQTIFNGALGAYAQFQNDKLRELNNQIQEQKMKEKKNLRRC